MTPFEPAGEEARWKVVYRLLKSKSVGDVLTYAEMGEALGMDPDEDRHSMQMALRRAAKEYLTVDQHALDVMPNVGYRVVTPPEHMNLAKRQQRRSRKALTRGHAQVVHVDMNGMEPEVRKGFELMALAFSAQMSFMKRMDVRQSRLEQAVSAVTPRVERTETEVAELRERLARLEGQTVQPEAGGAVAS